MLRRVVLVLALVLIAAPPASADTYATWPGARAPGTPSRYDRVNAVIVGPASARNVLVLVPGTQAGAGYMLQRAR